MSNRALAAPFASGGGSATIKVSLFRLYLLRAGYLLLVVGLGLQIWPTLIHHAPAWPLMNGVVSSLLGAIGLLAVLGLRYPLGMLPLLLFELVWKIIWLVAVARPLWSAGRIDADTAETVTACLIGAVFLVVIPWRYVFAHYVARPGDRWR